MRSQTIKEIRIVFGIVGTTGAICTLIGSAYILLGGISFGVVKLSEFIKPKQAIIGQLLSNGGIFVGGGLFVMGAGMAVCDKLNDVECEQTYAELREQEKRLEEVVIPKKCIFCKYYSASKYLPCAVHPNLETDCKDWEP